MHWPQITMIVFIAVSGTFNLLKHGQSREDETHNFGLWAVGAAIEGTVLYCGGFFG